MSGASDRGGLLPTIVREDGQKYISMLYGKRITPYHAKIIVGGLILALIAPDVLRLTGVLQLRILATGVIWGLAAVGLNLLTRHSELHSFGHAAFFGTAAYTVAILAAKFDVSSVFVLLAAATLTGTIAAVIVGFLVKRNAGLTFALLMLAFGQLLFSYVRGSSYFNFTNGVGVRPGEAGQPLILGIEFGNEVYQVLIYYISILFVVVALLITWRVVNSGFGYAQYAIGQDQTRAEYIGIDVEKQIWMVVAVSGIYTGLAGGLFALLTLHVLPGETLHFLVSGHLLFMGVLGGFQTLLGPFVGGVVLTVLQKFSPEITSYFNFLTGAVILIIVFVFPKGIVGTIQDTDLSRERVEHALKNPSAIKAWFSNRVAYWKQKISAATERR